jgi:hypothetical protein
MIYGTDNNITRDYGGASMKKLLCICFIMLFCLAATLAHASEKLDMNKATCGDVNLTEENELTVLISWMDGYLSAKSGDMVIDLSTIEKNLEHIVKTCLSQKNYKLKGFLQ